MVDIIKGLENWRKSRNMNDKEFILDVELSNILEEIAEYLRADTDYDRIDALCDISVFSINAFSYISIEQPKMNGSKGFNIYILLQDIANLRDIYNNNSLLGVLEPLEEYINITMGMMENLGYDYKKCMLETIKEISSREQCPIQVIEWQENGISGKWQKNKNQDSKTLYKANYESCKIKN